MRRFANPLALGRRELIVVYIMMIVASAIPTMGLSEYLLTIIAGAQYFATPENEPDHVGWFRLTCLRQQLQRPARLSQLYTGDPTRFVGAYFPQCGRASFSLQFSDGRLFYLINLDIAFSLWFFNTIAKLIRGGLSVLGVDSTEKLGIYGAASEPILAHQGQGALMGWCSSGSGSAASISAMWCARRSRATTVLMIAGRCFRIAPQFLFGLVAWR